MLTTLYVLLLILLGCVVAIVLAFTCAVLWFAFGPIVIRRRKSHSPEGKAVQAGALNLNEAREIRNAEDRNAELKEEWKRWIKANDARRDPSVWQ